MNGLLMIWSYRWVGVHTDTRTWRSIAPIGVACIPRHNVYIAESTVWLVVVDCEAKVHVRVSTGRIFNAQLGHRMRGQVPVNEDRVPATLVVRDILSVCWIIERAKAVGAFVKSVLTTLECLCIGNRIKHTLHHWGIWSMAVASNLKVGGGKRWRPSLCHLQLLEWLKFRQ